MVLLFLRMCSNINDFYTKFKHMKMIFLLKTWSLFTTVLERVNNKEI